MLPIDTDIDARQKDIGGTLDRKISPPISPHIQIHIVGGKKILLVRIHKAEPHQKPVYILDRGPKKVAYKRIGSTNINLTDDDLERIYVERSIQPADSRPLPDFGMDSIDLDLVDKWKSIAKIFRPTSRLIPLDSLNYYNVSQHLTLREKWRPERGAA